VLYFRFFFLNSPPEKRPFIRESGVNEHPGGDLPTSKSQSDNDEASSFDSVVFMYGMFAGVIAQFATFGFLPLISFLVAHGDAASMAKILEDSTKMMRWIGVIVGITFSSATYFLFVKLLRIGFLDINPRSSGEKDKEEEHKDNHMISTLELTFALGSLVSVLDTNSCRNK
jgi:hypothetical protein